MRVENYSPGKRAIVRVLGVFAIIIFTAYLPLLWWEITWPDLFYIVTNNSTEIQLTNTISKVLQGLGITENNLHSWAFERILICVSIAIGLIIFLFLITKHVGGKTYIKEHNDEL